MRLIELFNKAGPVEPGSSSDSYQSFRAQLDDGGTLLIEFTKAMFSDDGANEWELEFKKIRVGEAPSQATNKKTGDGGEIEIMSIVMNLATKFLRDYQPNVLEFSAERPENDPRPDSRAKLYRHMAKRIAAPFHYEVTEQDNNNHVFFRLTKQGYQRAAAKAWDWR